MIRLAIRVRREKAEMVLAELLELVPAGVEEVETGDEMIEFGVYGTPGELPALPELRAAAAGALVEISTSEVADDWPERWRAYHRPIVVGDRLTVRPPWEPPDPTQLDVVVDPGQAFGTGGHATTRLCLEFMLELDAEGDFVDLGCGSGVLAIAAARLGFAPVLALDNDQAAVDATAANSAANGVEIEVRKFDLRSERVPQARTVAANLLASLLKEWAADLADSPAVPDRVIAGGLLADEGDSVAAVFAARGLREMRRYQQSGWLALLLEQQTPVAPD